MGFVRSSLSVVVVGAALVVARPALSSPAVTDHLLSGAATSREALLVAGEEGAVYELRGGALLEVSPGSTFSFEPSIRLKLRKPGDPDTAARSIRLVRGRLEVTIPAKFREQTAVFLHGAGKLSAVAKEGVSCFVSDDDRTTAASRSGEMLVGIGNEWKALHEGLARTLSPEDPSALPRPIVGAPSPQADHALVVVEGGHTGGFSATWAPVKDAVSYDIAFSSVLEKSHAARHTVTPATAARWSDLASGSYAVTVAAIDRSGLTGAASERATVRVVGVRVPDGTSVASDGTISLGRDQRVSLTGGSGLEVSYGASSMFLSAPSTLGLAHNAPTIVRLRAPGSKEETVVRLEPAGLRANVKIGPKVARWPLDHVVVDIELYDTNGRPIPEDADVAPTITVNLTPVSVKWVRTGRAMHGELAPGTTPGPWVVRAEVLNRRGELIGRDFLEVAPLDPHGTATATAALSR
jgi:hypothetical protein